jgi:hypothetical protein
VSSEKSKLLAFIFDDSSKTFWKVDIIQISFGESLSFLGKILLTKYLEMNMKFMDGLCEIYR